MRGRISDQGLDSIAGRPRFIARGTGNFDLDNTGDPLAARTLYTVFTQNQNGLAGQVANIAVFGQATDVPSYRQLTLRLNTNASLGVSAQNRLTGGIGPTASAPNRGTLGFLGRHVAYWGMSAGGGTFIGIDGGTPTTYSAQPVDQLPNTRVSHPLDLNRYANERITLVYDGVHTASQRARIEAWLRNNSPYWQNLLSYEQSSADETAMASVSSGLGFQPVRATMAYADTYPEAGLRSLAITSDGTSNDSYVIIGNTLAGQRYGLRAGSTYTVQGTVRNTTDVVGGAGRQLRMLGWTWLGTTPSTLISSDSPPLTPNTYRHIKTFTVPAQSTWDRIEIRLYHGGTNADPVYWDRLGIYRHAAHGGPPADWWSPGFGY